MAELSTDNHHYSLPVGSTVKHKRPNKAKFPAAYRGSRCHVLVATHFRIIRVHNAEQKR